MFSALRKRIHVSPATAIATLALVFAMTGGAYAAKHYLITSTKQISPKVLKALQGKAGKAGANGVAGAAGLAGVQGAQGAAGAAGVKGETGATGATGTAGAAGAPGLEGSFNKTLPKGKTLTGDWAIFTKASEGGIEAAAGTTVSFGIPLEAAPIPVYVKEGETTAPAGCTGNVKEPGAEEGHLCIFASLEVNFVNVHICSAAEPSINCLIGSGGTADPSGAFIGVLPKEAGILAANGTWAVTAE